MSGFCVCSVVCVIVCPKDIEVHFFDFNWSWWFVCVLRACRSCESFVCRSCVWLVCVWCLCVCGWCVWLVCGWCVWCVWLVCGVMCAKFLLKFFVRKLELCSETFKLENGKLFSIESLLSHRSKTFLYLFIFHL